MTDPASPTTAPAPAASTPAAPVVAPPVVAPPDGTVADLTAKLTAANERNQNLTTQVATLTTERNTFKAQVDEAAPKLKRLGELETTVTTMKNEKNERSFIEGLKASGKLPGADDITLAGAVAKLHEAGKFNRFAEDWKAEVAKALPILITEAPALTRPPTNGGGGSPGAHQGPPVRRRKSLVG